MPGAALGAAKNVGGGKFFPAGRRYTSHSSTTSLAERPLGSTSMTVRPSIIDADEIGAVVDGDRRHRAMLRQRDGGFIGDLGLGGRGIDDEDQRLPCAVAKVDRRTDGAKVVRAWKWSG